MPADHYPVPLDPAAWESVNDDVMGGVSASSVQALAGGGLRFAGHVSLDYGGGFASARVPFVLPAGASASAVRATVRGDGKRYRLTAFVRATGSPGRAAYHYQCAFTAGGGEQPIELPLAAFVARYRGRAVDAPPLAAADLVAIGLQIADQQAGAFALDVLALALVTPE
jgi:monofunctional biosynthetic peptidoglycan transglycosylase